ncbi:MAG: chromosomal replication initiator protein DnaA [Candidatus Nitrospinota bacterium M3_3B_026]
MPSHRLWAQLKDTLKEKLNPHNYESWIEPVDVVSFKGKELALSVPSTFFIEWIEEHYREIMEKTLSEMTGGDVKISLVVANRKNGADGGARPATAQDPDVISQARARANLNEKYTFANFVVGKSNEFSNASARAVTKKIGEAYNPLFIYGGVGLGKTHLMQAIGNEALEKNPALNVLYISSEKFVNKLISAIQRGSMAAFRKRFRSLDLLLVDDVQFIGGKERTQEEFFHTFNSLFEMKKQIVISSDKFPRDITNLEERLRSRFAWGLIADIQPPELETKIAILKKIAHQNGFRLDSDVAAYLANKIRSNIRELEGCLARVMAYASLTGQDINIDMAKETLKGIYDDATRMIDIRQIQKAVCDYYKIKVVDLKSKNRSKKVMIPRHTAVYLAREYTNTSLPEIGRAFGGRDHTTVMHSIRKIKKDIEQDTRLYNDINEIKKTLDL